MSSTIWRNAKRIAIAAGLLGGLVAPCRPSSAQSNESGVIAELRAKVIAQIKDKDGKEKRYTGQHCSDLTADSPFWATVAKAYKGLKVQDCSPTISEKSLSSGGSRDVKGRALMLLPDETQITSWLIEACHAIGRHDADLRRCANKVFAYVVGQNTFQYVVSGLIWEPKNESYDPEDEGKSS